MFLSLYQSIVCLCVYSVFVLFCLFFFSVYRFCVCYAWGCCLFISACLSFSNTQLLTNRPLWHFFDQLEAANAALQESNPLVLKKGEKRPLHFGASGYKEERARKRHSKKGRRSTKNGSDDDDDDKAPDTDASCEDIMRMYDAVTPLEAADLGIDGY